MGSKIDDALKESGAELARWKKHRVYKLPNGRSLTVPSTPSDWRTEANTLAELRRQLRAKVSPEVKARPAVAAPPDRARPRRGQTPGPERGDADCAIPKLEPGPMETGCGDLTRDLRPKNAREQMAMVSIALNLSPRFRALDPWGRAACLLAMAPEWRSSRFGVMDWVSLDMLNRLDWLLNLEEGLTGGEWAAMLAAIDDLRPIPVIMLSPIALIGYERFAFIDCKAGEFFSLQFERLERLDGDIAGWIGHRVNGEPVSVQFYEWGGAKMRGCHSRPTPQWYDRRAIRPVQAEIHKLYLANRKMQDQAVAESWDDFGAVGAPDPAAGLPAAAADGRIHNA